MCSAADLIAEQELALAALMRQGLSLAANLHERALAADDEQAPRLAAAWHRIARSTRQTIALQQKAARERAREAREAEQHDAGAHEHRLARRKAQLRAELERLVFTEHEGEEAEDLIEELELQLAIEALDPRFVEEPVGAQIERLYAEIGVGRAGEAAPPPRSASGRPDEAAPPGVFEPPPAWPGAAGPGP